MGYAKEQMLTKQLKQFEKEAKKETKEKNIAREINIFSGISLSLFFILVLAVSFAWFYPEPSQERFDVRIVNENTYNECLCTCDANFSLDRNAYIYESNQRVGG